MPELPAYRDLPATPGAPPGSAWGLWGSDDQLGTLNLLTPERVVEGARLVRKGAVFPLNLSVDQPDPPLYGRGKVQQTVVGGPNGRDDYLDNFWPQASSQWDSLRHIRHPEHGWYNGVMDEEIVAGRGKLGIENMARRGIAGRGVLLDIARYRQRRGQPIDFEAPEAITPEELIDCAGVQGLKNEPGDILLIRTGWLTWYFQQPTEVRERISDRSNLIAPGLGPPDEMAGHLWNLRVSAVAADNPALEVWPPSDFMHWRLIPLLGMPIGELWWLDDLAADCAEDGVYEFFFTSAPLNVPGGVGSPPNALAIK